MASKTKYELALEIGGKIQSSLEKSVGGVNKKLDSIGKAATSYYIEEVDLKFVKKKFKENHKRAEKESKRALEPA